MGEIVIKIPKNRRKINILQTRDAIEKETSRRLQFLSNVLELKKKQAEPIEQVVEEVDTTENEIQEPPKSVFTEIFTISNTNKPTQIEFFAPTEPSIDWEQLELELQDAYDRGFRDGQDTTKAFDEREFQKLRQMNRIIDHMVDSFRLEYSKQMELLKTHLVDLSITIAEQIIKYEIDKDKNFFINQLKNVLNEIDRNVIYKLFINPKDLEIFEESKSVLLSDPSVFENTRIIVDESIEQGFCKLDTSIGEFDASLRSQLDNIRFHLMQEIKSEDVESQINEIKNTHLTDRFSNDNSNFDQ